MHCFAGLEMKIIRYLETIFDFTVDALAFFAGVLLVLIMLSVSLDVVMRYFLNRPQFWVGEMCEYALLYITFTGTAWVLKRDGHVKIDILYTILNPKTKKILGVVVCVIGIFVCAVLTYFGVYVAWDHYVRGVYNPTLMSFPKGPLLAIIPVGTFLLMVQFFRRAVRSLTDPGIR